MIYYYLIFFLAAISAIGGDLKIRRISFIFIAVILVLFAGTRLNIDADYLMYYKNMQYIEKTPKDFTERLVPVEWCLYVIPHFFELFFYSQVDIIRASFFTFALCGVLAKLIAIKRFAAFFFLSIILYVSDLYFMQDMTTIRAGVAAGIFLLSLDDLDKNNNKGFLIKLLFCFFFHSSSVLFIIPWIMLKFKLNIKFYYFTAVVSLITALAKVNIITLLFLDRIFPRVEGYIKAMEWMKEKEANIFNFKAIFAMMIIMAFAFFYKRMKDIPYFETLFKIHIISLCLFFLLSGSAQVFSIRTFEMFSIIQTLLYPLLIFIFTPKLKIIGWAIVILFSLIQLYYIIDVADIYKPYKSWLSQTF